MERPLPAPGDVAQTALRLLNRPDTTPADLAQALAEDPLLAYRMIVLAHSPVCAGPPALADLADALRRIGPQALRPVLLGFSLIERYRRSVCRDFDDRAFWAQSLATAVAARHIGGLMELCAPVQCFALGLLARIGEIALATLHPDDYGVVHLALAHAPATRVANLEQSLFSADRHGLAARLLRTWGVPEGMALAVQACGDPAVAGLLPHSAALRVARLLQTAVLLGRLLASTERERPGDRLPELQRVCADNRLRVAELRDALPCIVREWRDWAAVFGVSLEGFIAAPLVATGPFAPGRRPLEESGGRPDAEACAVTAFAPEAYPSTTAEAGRALAALASAVWTSASAGAPLALMRIRLDPVRQLRQGVWESLPDAARDEAVRALAGCAPSGDSVWRLGGVELMIIAPATGLPMAVRLLERFRAAAGGRPGDCGEARLAATFCAGVALYAPARTPRRRSAEALLQVAEEALRLAAARGANRSWLTTGWRPARSVPGRAAGLEVPTAAAGGLDGIEQRDCPRQAILCACPTS